MAFSEYEQHDALGLAELVRKRQVSASELLDEAIARADRLNPALNAIITRIDDTARTAAKNGLPDGPFSGVPFLLKDLGPYLAGVPMQMGSRALKGFVPNRDSELTRRFKASGLNIFGKTNTPEFGNSGYTEPVAFGPARNPWDTTRTPGGSSGGSAAAVAAGIVPMAHGNDGGGSLRIPASCAGLFGMKASRGRTPGDAEIPDLLGALVVDGVMSRSVRDSAAALDVLRGVDTGLLWSAPEPKESYLASAGRDPGRLRIASITHPMFAKSLDPECQTGQANAMKLLTSLGHIVEGADPKIDYAEALESFIVLFFTEIAQAIEIAETSMGRSFSRREIEVVPWFARSYFRSLPPAMIARATYVQGKLARQYASFMEQYDVLLMPTLGMPPIKVGALQPTSLETTMIDIASATRFGPLAKTIIKELGAKAFSWTPSTPLFNMTGQPGMSVPLHWSADGLPVGMQFIGRYGDETTLFQLAGQLERAQPWFDKRPPSKV
ncbi:MAG TPA: amidase family protein [Magnetospirillaceae bacterium]|jgi:amidase